MHAAVELLYRDGVAIKPMWPPLVGQLFTADRHGLPVLNLWSLDWVENAPDNGRLLASICHPVVGRIGYDDLLVRGIEFNRRAGGQRSWTVQKWRCRVLTAQMARDYLNDRWSAPPPSADPPGPPPPNPDRPFD